MPQYKTIVLELLEQQPQIHDQLRREKKLLLTMETYASELKSSHLAWMEFLTQIRPGSNKHQVSSEALEFALKELKGRMPSASGPDESVSQFLDAAMLFIRNPRTPRG
jgi:hypothetical protein